jgi:hypothetical protein
VRQFLAKTIAGQGRDADAEAYMRETLAIRKRALPDHPDTVYFLYNLACLAALQGKRAQALSYLRDAVERGWPNADHTEQDSDLSILRGDPEFQRLVTAARENQRRRGTPAGK